MDRNFWIYLDEFLAENQERYRKFWISQIYLNYQFLGRKHLQINASHQSCLPEAYI